MMLKTVLIKIARYMHIPTIGFCMLLLFTPLALTALSFDEEPETPIFMTYDGQTLTISKTIVVEKTGGARRNAMLTFSTGVQSGFDPRQAFLEGSAFQQSINYQITKSDGNILKDTTAPEASETNFLANSLNHSFPPGRRTHAFTYLIGIPADQFVQSGGTYENTVRITLYERPSLDNIDNIVYQAHRDIEIKIFSEASVELFIDPSTIDFGLLEPSLERAAELLVKSNIRYSISVSSTNQGKLVHEAPSIDDVVPYSFFFDNNPNAVAFSSPGHSVLLKEDLQPTGGDTDRFLMTIRIGDFGLVASGEYKDVLIFSIKAD